MQIARKVQFIDTSIAAIVEEGQLRQINIRTMHILLLYDFIDTTIQLVER